MLTMEARGLCMGQEGDRLTDYKPFTTVYPIYAQRLGVHGKGGEPLCAHGPWAEASGGTEESCGGSRE